MADSDSTWRSIRFYLWQQRGACFWSLTFLLTWADSRGLMSFLKQQFSLWFPLWLKLVLFYWTKPDLMKASNSLLLLFSPAWPFWTVSCSCPECCQPASQWRVAEDFSWRSGQQGLHQILCAPETPESHGGKVGEHLHQFHGLAG